MAIRKRGAEAISAEKLGRLGCLGRLWERYTILLAAYPLPVQCMTSAVLWALGELLQQIVSGGI
eukprot:scaffold670335_cov62-Prasinocladus_malaysianus.AAC.1